MTKKKPFSKVILIVIGVSILAALVLSWVLNTNTSDTNSISFKASNKSKPLVGASPSYGPLIDIVKLPAYYKNDDAVIDASRVSNAEIRKGQSVALYNKKGAIMPLGASVSNIDDMTRVMITLPKSTNVELLSNEVGVLVIETRASKRLPTSALQKDENGETYVWIAQLEEGTEKYNIRRQYIKISIQNGVFFEESGYKIKSKDLVITTPHSDIQSDKSYDVTIEEFEAPTNNPIKQAWIDFEVHYLEQEQARLKQLAADCKNGKSAAQGADPSTGNESSESCGNSAITDSNDPLAIFNSLINQPVVSGSNACGSGASECGQ